MSSLDRQLMELGLTNMQARIYVAALRLGKVSASEIAKASEVNRVTTYSTLDELEAIGLIKADDFDQIRVYEASDPKHLERLFMVKAKAAIQAYRDVQGLLPDLKNVAHRSVKVPRSFYGEGEKDVKTYLTRIPESESLRAAYIADAGHYDLIKALVKQAAEHDVRPQAIISNSVNASLLAYLDHRVVPHQIAQVEATTLLFHDRTVYLMQDQQFFQIYAVEDPRIARVALAAFNLNWRILSGHHLIMAEEKT